MKDNDEFSGHVRRVTKCLETVSGIGAKAITAEATGAATKLVMSIDGLDDVSRLFIMTSAQQLAESFMEGSVNPNHTNNCRGSVTRYGITQHVIDSANGEC